MNNSTIPYEQWAISYLAPDLIKVECHRNETPQAVEMIESYIEEA